MRNSGLHGQCDKVAWESLGFWKDKQEGLGLYSDPWLRAFSSLPHTIRLDQQSHTGGLEASAGANDIPLVTEFLKIQISC